MEPVNSTTFIKRPRSVTDKDGKFLFTKELLSNRIFSGFYRERKYVANLNEYRDVVIISPEEYDLIEDVDRLRKKWHGVSDLKWVGITGSEGLDAPKARCFWVKLTNIPFGHYWFLVKHVKLKDGELFLQLKCLRKSYKSEMVVAPPESAAMKNEQPETSSAKPNDDNYLKIEIDFKTIGSTMLTTARHICAILSAYVTWRNLYKAARTTCAFIVFLVLGAFCFIGNLGDFVLKLLREFTLFVHAFSPIVVQIIDFLTKLVGGFYILIAGMFGGGGGGNRTRRPPQTFQYKPPVQHTPINWRERNERLRKELLINSMKR